MSKLKRRDFIKSSLSLGATYLGVASLAPGLLSACASLNAQKSSRSIARSAIGRVVIIGGGYAGTTAAKYIRLWSLGSIDVVVIEKSSQFVSCPLSNLVLGGSKSINDLTFGYDLVKKNHGVTWVNDEVTAIDAAAKKVMMKRGEITYDRLIIAPGVDFNYASLPNLEAAQEAIPHAWKAGWQTVNLRKQLEAMSDGGLFVMNVPSVPYRCPPGPYERACMIAHYLKTKTPKSKLVILDPKRAFSKQPVFMEAFDKYYKGIIEMNLSNEIDDYAVTKIDAKTRTLTTKAGKSWKADVANVIPSQRAGAIAVKMGLAQGDWCPVNAENFTSTQVKEIYVLGDAAIAAEMPKSAFSANSQAKVVAADILSALAKKPKFSPNFRNTCWSMLAPDDSVKIGAGYVPKGQKLDPVAPFVSKPGEDAALRKQVFQESVAWYDGIVADVFAKGAKKG